MGRWMCEHAMNKGFAATVYNRSKDKAQPLLDKGAKWAETPKQVAENADVVRASWQRLKDGGASRVHAGHGPIRSFPPLD